MNKTATGMFENSGLADTVVQALIARGISAKGIRVLVEPHSMDVTGSRSTPDLDFHAALVQDLRAMGATEKNAEAYSRGVREGRVLVFATGSDEQADAALEIMNRNGAAAPEQLHANEVHLPASDPAGPASRLQPGTGGARLFVW